MKKVLLIIGCAALSLSSASAEPASETKSVMADQPARMTKAAGYQGYDGIFYGNICRNGVYWCQQLNFTPIGGPCYCAAGFSGTTTAG